MHTIMREENQKCLSFSLHPKIYRSLAVVAYTFNTSILETKAGGSL